MSSLYQQIKQIVFKVANRLLSPLHVSLSTHETLRNLESRYQLRQPLAEQALAGKRRAVVLDIGASIGSSIADMLAVCPDAAIYAFEPQPDQAQKIRDRFQANPNISVFTLGIGDQSGVLSFHVNERLAASSFLPSTTAGLANAPFLKETKQIEVEVVRLDDWYHSLPQPPNHIDLIKLDVQGYEQYVINGGAEVLARTNWLIIEVSFIPSYTGQLTYEQLIPLCQSHGFVVKRVAAGFYSRTTGELIEADVLLERSQV